MPDRFDRKTRSRIMSRIRGKNTKPEVLIRNLLEKMGVIFEIHRKDLPGTPDIVLPASQTVIFVNGCFWHGHECHLFHWPDTDTGFWRNKITRTRERDTQNILKLQNEGWSIVIIWECALRGKSKLPPTQLEKKIANAIANQSKVAHISGDISKDTTC